MTKPDWIHTPEKYVDETTPQGYEAWRYLHCLAQDTLEVLLDQKRYFRIRRTPGAGGRELLLKCKAQEKELLAVCEQILGVTTPKERSP